MPANDHHIQPGTIGSLSAPLAAARPLLEGAAVGPLLSPISSGCSPPALAGGAAVNSVGGDGRPFSVEPCLPAWSPPSGVGSNCTQPALLKSTSTQAWASLLVMT